MSDFQDKLIKHISKSRNNVASHFKYGETTYIAPEVVYEIFGLIQQNELLQELWEKEKDYNRLLRKENDELQEELQYSYEDEYDEDEDSDKDEKEYLS